jgi:hypothetical protein
VLPTFVSRLSFILSSVLVLLGILGGIVDNEPTFDDIVITCVDADIVAVVVVGGTVVAVTGSGLCGGEVKTAHRAFTGVAGWVTVGSLVLVIGETKNISAHQRKYISLTV